MIVRAVQDVFDSAISWATFRLRGGWPVLIGLFLLAGVAIIGLMQLSLAGTHGPNAPPHAALYEYKLWAWWLCVIQSLILGFGAFSAGSSISRDVRSGMMQSNRLMPVRPTVAVWGYLYGAFSTALAPALALFFIGLVVYPRGHHSDLAWIFINLILLLSTALWSTLLALGALINGVLYNTFFIAIGVILMINHSFALVPAILLMFAVYYHAGTLLLAGHILGSTLSNIALAALPLFTITLFAGAVRKYRYPLRPAFGDYLGILLLLLWTAANYIGLRHRVVLYHRVIQLWRLFGFARVPAARLEFFVALATILLLGTIPVSGAAVLDQLPRRLRRDVPAPADNAAPEKLFQPPHAPTAPARDTANSAPAENRRRRRPLGLLTLLSALIIAVLFCAMGSPYKLSPGPIVETGAIILFAYLGVYAVRRAAQRTSGPSSSIISKAWIVTVWFMPYVAAGIVDACLGKHRPMPGKIIRDISPLCALYYHWYSVHLPYARLGVAFAALFAGLATFMVAAAERRLRRRAAGAETFASPAMTASVPENQ